MYCIVSAADPGSIGSGRLSLSGQKDQLWTFCLFRTKRSALDVLPIPDEKDQLWI